LICHLVSARSGSPRPPGVEPAIKSGLDRRTDEAKSIHDRAARSDPARGRCGAPIRELCRRYGITETTFYRWRRCRGVQEARVSPAALNRCASVKWKNSHRNSHRAADSKSAAPGGGIRCCAFCCPSWARSRRPSPKENGRCLCTGHCPSWARTRTLLIQRGQRNHLNPSNLLLKREFVAPDAGVCWVPCWTLPYFTHTNARLCRSVQSRTPSLRELRRRRTRSEIRIIGLQSIVGSANCPGAGRR